MGSRGSKSQSAKSASKAAGGMPKSFVGATVEPSRWWIDKNYVSEAKQYALTTAAVDRETEKAVHVKSEYGGMWVPKSALDGYTDNIGWHSLKEKPVTSAKKKSSSPFAGMDAFQKNDKLVSIAKSAGITGVRKHQKLANIVKAAKAQGKFDSISNYVTETEFGWKYR